MTLPLLLCLEIVYSVKEGREARRIEVKGLRNEFRNYKIRHAPNATNEGVKSEYSSKGAKTGAEIFMNLGG